MKIIGGFPDSMIFVPDDLRSIERNDDRDDRVIKFILFLQSSLESIPVRNHCCPNVIARPLRRLGRYLDRFQESPESVVARRD